jgi:hypothetical protein
MAVLEHFQNKGNPDQRAKMQKIKNAIFGSKINGCSRCDAFISGRAGSQNSRHCSNQTAAGALLLQGA